MNHFPGPGSQTTPPLVAEIDRLRAELKVDAIAFSNMRSALAAERKDAERYRWLRDKANYSNGAKAIGALGLGPFLDEAVDAAMKEGK